MALREELAKFETGEVPYVDTTNWTDARLSVFESVEDAAAKLIARARELTEANAKLEAALRHAKQREARLTEENQQMRKDIAYTLERVERALDALAVG